MPDWLNGRARELWKPLLAVASLADQHPCPTVTRDLLTLAKDHVERRAGISAESEALLAILDTLLENQPSMIIRPGQLPSLLGTRLGWKHPQTPEQVGGWLGRLGIPKAKPHRDKDGVRYEVTRQQLREVQARYHSPQTHIPTPTSPNPAP